MPVKKKKTPPSYGEENLEKKNAIWLSMLAPNRFNLMKEKKNYKSIVHSYYANWWKKQKSFQNLVSKPYSVYLLTWMLRDDCFNHLNFIDDCCLIESPLCNYLRSSQNPRNIEANPMKSKRKDLNAWCLREVVALYSLLFFSLILEA